jgi:DNA polymerase elongation subunit (family B)
MFLIDAQLYGQDIVLTFRMQNRATRFYKIPKVKFILCQCKAGERCLNSFNSFTCEIVTARDYSTGEVAKFKKIWIKESVSEFETSKRITEICSNCKLYDTYPTQKTIVAKTLFEYNLELYKFYQYDGNLLFPEQTPQLSMIDPSKFKKIQEFHQDSLEWKSFLLSWTVNIRYSNNGEYSMIIPNVTKLTRRATGWSKEALEIVYEIALVDEVRIFDGQSEKIFTRREAQYTDITQRNQSDWNVIKEFMDYISEKDPDVLLFRNTSQLIFLKDRCEYLGKQKDFVACMNRLPQDILQRNCISVIEMMFPNQKNYKYGGLYGPFILNYNPFTKETLKHVFPKLLGRIVYNHNAVVSKRSIDENPPNLVVKWHPIYMNSLSVVMKITGSYHLSCEWYARKSILIYWIIKRIYFTLTSGMNLVFPSPDWDEYDNKDIDTTGGGGGGNGSKNVKKRTPVSEDPTLENVTDDIFEMSVQSYVESTRKSTSESISPTTVVTTNVSGSTGSPSRSSPVMSSKEKKLKKKLNGGSYLKRERSEMFISTSEMELIEVDNQAYYPNILMMMNLCKSTVRMSENPEPFTEPSIERMENETLIDKKWIVVDNEIKEGIIPFIMNSLLTKRKEFIARIDELEKNPKLDSRSKENQTQLEFSKTQNKVYKEICAIIYGCLAGKRPGNVVSAPMASDVCTAIGRKLWSELCNFLKSKGHQVIHGQTDGVMIYTKNGKNLQNDLIEFKSIGYPCYPEIRRRYSAVYLRDSVSWIGVEKSSGTLVNKGVISSYSPQIQIEIEKAMFAILLSGQSPGGKLCAALLETLQQILLIWSQYYDPTKVENYLVFYHRPNRKEKLHFELQRYSISIRESIDTILKEASAKKEISLQTQQLLDQIIRSYLPI